MLFDRDLLYAGLVRPLIFVGTPGALVEGHAVNPLIMRIGQPIYVPAYSQQPNSLHIHV